MFRLAADLRVYLHREPIMELCGATSTGGEVRIASHLQALRLRGAYIWVAYIVVREERLNG
jgi:hypothetical protein